MSDSARRLCLVNPSSGVAGPAAFQRRLAAGLAARGCAIAYGLGDRPYQAALVVGGTRELAGLARLRRQGMPVLQRLDGINWLHRRLPTGPRHYLRAEANNLLVRFIRRRLADRLVYQSHFAQRWWEREYGPAAVPASVVYNGVPLDRFTPEGPEAPPADRIELLVVEGRLAGGYEHGLRAAAALAGRLAQFADKPVRLTIAGEVAEGVKATIGTGGARPGAQGVRPMAGKGDSARPAEGALSTSANGGAIRLRWLGRVDPEAIPALDRSAHLLFSADLNPACPNAAIEAMACGLPVVSFHTGALPELVQGESGRLSPYGGDPWQLDPPDIDGLAEAAAEVLAEHAAYRRGARLRAEQAFSQEHMVDGYLQALGWD